MVKKFIKGKNMSERAKIPKVKQPHKQPVQKSRPNAGTVAVQQVKESQNVKGNEARLAYAKKQRNKLSK